MCAQTAPQVHLDLLGSQESLETKDSRDLLGNLDKMVSRSDTSHYLWSIAAHETLRRPSSKHVERRVANRARALL